MLGYFSSDFYKSITFYIGEVSTWVVASLLICIAFFVAKSLFKSNRKRMTATNKPLDFMVVSEPNSLTTMHIYDIVNKEYYNGLDSYKEGRKYRHRTMRMRSPSKLKITIYNRSAKDASIVFFYF